MRPTFVFRRLVIDDLPLFAEWLARPHVAEWWGTPSTLDDLAREYGADISRASTLGAYFAYVEGDPVAFIQVYDVMNADPEWWRDETDPGARGIDQFLANEAQLREGARHRARRAVRRAHLRGSCGHEGADRSFTGQRTRDPRIREGRVPSGRGDRDARRPGLAHGDHARGIRAALVASQKPQVELQYEERQLLSGFHFVTPAGYFASQLLTQLAVVQVDAQ